MLSSFEIRSQGSNKCHGTPLSSIEDIQRRLIPPNPTQNTNNNNNNASLRICTPSPQLARIKKGLNDIDSEEVKTTVVLEDYLDSSLLSIAVSKYAASESILGKSKIVQSFEWPIDQLEPMNSIEIVGSEWQSYSSENNDTGHKYSENCDVKSNDFHTFDRMKTLFKM